MNGWTETVPGVWTKVFGERLCVVRDRGDAAIAIVFTKDSACETRSFTTVDSVKTQLEAQYGLEEIQCGDGSIVVMSRDRKRVALVSEFGTGWSCDHNNTADPYGAKESALSAARAYVNGGAK